MITTVLLVTGSSQISSKTGSGINILYLLTGPIPHSLSFALTYRFSTVVTAVCTRPYVKVTDQSTEEVTERLVFVANFLGISRTETIKFGRISCVTENRLAKVLIQDRTDTLLLYVYSSVTLNSWPLTWSTQNKGEISTSTVIWSTVLLPSEHTHTHTHKHRPTTLPGPQRHGLRRIHNGMG